MVHNGTMRVRVGLVSTAAVTTGGAATYDRALKGALLQIDSEVDLALIRFASERTSSVVVDPDPTVVRYQKNPRPLTLARRIVKRLGVPGGNGLPSLQEALDAECVDIAWFLAPNRVIGSVLRTPFVMPVWDLAHREVQGFSEFSAERRWSHREEIYGSNLARAFHVVTDSLKTGREIERIYGVYPQNWSSFGLPLPEKPSSDSTLADSLKEKYFYYPASYWPHKNHRILIDALSTFPDPNFLIVFSGHDEGHREALEGYVQASGLSERVKFFGRVSDEEVQGLIEGSIAVLMPSVLGPTNYPPLEAWRSNIPAVVSSAHEFDEVPDSGMLVVDPHDLSGWSMAMAQFLGNEKPRVVPPSFEASGIEGQVGQVIEKFVRTLKSRLKV